MSTGKKDLLDELTGRYSGEDPEFPARLREAVARRELLHCLADQRRALALSQTDVAEAMGSSQSSVGRLETAAPDALISTAQRFAAAVGMRLELRLVNEPQDVDAMSPPTGEPRRRRGPSVGPRTRAQSSS